MMGGGGSGAPGGSGNGAPDSEARCGDVDGQADRVMYDRTIGCQVRTVRDVKADEAALSVPVASMVTPDLIASSDAGRAIFACVRSARSSSSDDPNNGDGVGGGGFWGAFRPTGKLEQAQAERIHQNSGTQLLVKILQERKRVETALVRHERISIENGGGGAPECAARVDGIYLVQGAVSGVPHPPALRERAEPPDCGSSEYGEGRHHPPPASLSGRGPRHLRALRPHFAVVGMLPHMLEAERACDTRGVHPRHAGFAERRGKDHAAGV